MDGHFTARRGGEEGASRQLLGAYGQNSLKEPKKANVRRERERETKYSKSVFLYSCASQLLEKCLASRLKVVLDLEPVLV